MEREEGESVFLMTVSKDISFFVATSFKGMRFKFNGDEGVVRF